MARTLIPLEQLDKFHKKLSFEDSCARCLEAWPCGFRRQRDEIALLRTALQALVDALHNATPDGPVLVGQAVEAAIAVLARTMST